MVGPRAPSAETIIHCFRDRINYSEDERRVLERMVRLPRKHAAGAELIANGDLLDKPLFILSGWAYTAVTLGDGSRQIIDFYMPGDMVGFCTRVDAEANCNTIALTQLVTANAAVMLSVVKADFQARYPGLCQTARLLEDEQELRYVRHIVRLGAQLAYARMANLILDLMRRNDQCGLVDGAIFHLPLTQEHLGNALGMSAVHVNRTLQQLRREGAIHLRGGKMEVLNMALLANAAADGRHPVLVQ